MVQPTAATAEPPPSSARSLNRPAACPKNRPAAIDAPKTPGPSPLTAGSAPSCRSRKSALQLSMPPSTTKAAAPRNPITSKACASRSPGCASACPGASSVAITSPVRAISSATVTRIGSRPTPAPRARPAPTAPTSTPTEYMPCASGISRAPVAVSMRPMFALMPTSTSPEPTPVSVSVTISTGSVVARPGNSVASAKTAQPIATARAPNRRTAGPASRNIEGIDPSETKSMATPNAPFDAPVASCTLGRTAAHAPQKRPSVRNPARVGFLRGIEDVDPDGVARARVAGAAEAEAELLRDADRRPVPRPDVGDEVVGLGARPRIGDRCRHRLRRETPVLPLLGDHPAHLDLVRVDAADPLARVMHLGEAGERFALEHRPGAEAMLGPVRVRLSRLEPRVRLGHERGVDPCVGASERDQAQPGRAQLRHPIRPATRASPNPTARASRPRRSATGARR